MAYFNFRCRARWLYTCLEIVAFYQLFVNPVLGILAFIWLSAARKEFLDPPAEPRPQPQPPRAQIKSLFDEYEQEKRMLADQSSAIPSSPSHVSLSRSRSAAGAAEFLHVQWPWHKSRR